MLQNEEINEFGIVNFRNQQRRFGIKLDDRRRHLYLVGKTGMGKTTFLENMVIADILAGRGLGVVDPHGEFAEKLLDFVPEERIKDVVYFDPSDLEYPISFNPLEQVTTEFRHLVASGIMGVFKKIWVDLWSARMEYILNNTLLALLEYPNSNLLGIMRMLSDKDYRKKVVDNLQDPVVKGFWVNEFARYSQKFETEATAAIQNKVGQFVTNPLIRNILGQSRSAIDMRKIMDEKKILIVNLSKGKIGEDNSALLGAMIITKLQLAAMSRVDIPESARKDFYLYVDEFQNFATDSFANILSEARKYRLCLILAHQYIRQLVHDMNTKVRDAIFGNVGTMVSFRVGAEDAEFLEKEFQPDFMANDFVNLPKYNFYIKLLIDGVSSRPFSATNIPPHALPEKNYKDVIIDNSRREYGTPKKIVEERIAGEWISEGSKAMDEKIMRRNEQPLSRVLKPMAESDGEWPDRSGSARQRFNRQGDRRSGSRSMRDLSGPSRPVVGRGLGREQLQEFSDRLPNQGLSSQGMNPSTRPNLPPPLVPKVEKNEDEQRVEQPEKKEKQKVDILDLRAALERTLNANAAQNNEDDDLEDVVIEE